MYDEDKYVTVHVCSNNKTTMSLAEHHCEEKNMITAHTKSNNRQISEDSCFSLQ